MGQQSQVRILGQKLEFLRQEPANRKQARTFPSGNETEIELAASIEVVVALLLVVGSSGAGVGTIRVISGRLVVTMTAVGRGRETAGDSGAKLHQKGVASQSGVQRRRKQICRQQMRLKQER